MSCSSKTFWEPLLESPKGRQSFFTATGIATASNYLPPFKQDYADGAVLLFIRLSLEEIGKVEAKKSRTLFENLSLRVRKFTRKTVSLWLVLGASSSPTVLCFSYLFSPLYFAPSRGAIIQYWLRASKEKGKKVG